MTPDPLSAQRRAAIAYSRFGLGVTRDGLSEALTDPRAALMAELKTPGLATGLPGTPELLRQVADYTRQRRARRQSPADTPNANAQMADAKKGGAKKGDDAPNLPTVVLQSEIEARLALWRAAPLGFYERLVMFWSNHFAISIDKNIPVRVLAGAYEREAIRPNVTGRFRDLLIAAERHPAMQLYLDNAASIGPNARANRNGKRGLNENLAREILELHTLGVNGGYNQADVTRFASVITGWGVDRSGQSADGFTFNPNAHEPGAQTVLGRTYDEDGEAQGIRVLDDLVRHPATARHIATKLVRHFVADQPPPALVEQVSRRFSDTDGDLTAVYAALLDAEESWTAPREKLRTPQEFTLAMLRALDTSLPPQRFAQGLKALGQPLWQPPGPNGFSDLAAVWATPEGLNNRLDLAYQMAARQTAQTDPRAFAEACLSGLIGDPTRRAVALAETRPQGLALVLLSPEFMRR